jgi:2-iminobutanoate/2-iminopropanoate deaminase
MPLKREVIEPKNPVLNISQNFRLPHSPGIRAGEFIFLSGMVAIDPATGERLHGTVAAETRQILTNMAHLLEAAGSSLAKIVKANVLIYSMLEYENMNSVYREFFPTDPPARTVCGVKLIGGHKVEIECVAMVEPGLSR